MRLWGRASSVNVQKVLWALDEFGLDYEHEVVGGRYGGLDRPDFARLAPVARVPVLEDGDLAVWESHAILRHLARTRPDHPLGAAMADPARAAGIDAWMEFGTSTLQPPFIGLFWQIVRMTEAQRSTEAMDRHREALRAALGVLEIGLDRAGPHICGDFSMADIALGSLTHRLFDVAPEFVDQFPRAANWHATLATCPAYARHVGVGYEELRAT